MTYMPSPEMANFLADRVTVGEESMPRSELTNGTLTVATGQFRFAYFTARKTEQSTQVRMISGGTAAGATPTLVRIGIYEVDGAGDATLAAATSAADTSLFSSVNTPYTKSWSSPFVKVAGRRYAVGVVVVTAATAPALAGSVIINSPEVGFAPRTCGVLTGQTDLPASFLDSSVVASGFRPYAVVLP